jgi:DNA-binding protein H-NS
MPKLRDLLEQQEKLAKEIAAAREEERAQALVTCLQLIADHKFTMSDLKLVKVTHAPPQPVKKVLKTFKPAKPKITYPPKYRDPHTGQTWSGRGHEPHWLKGKRDEYLIPNLKEAAGPDVSKLKDKFTSVHKRKS